jgi:hypothetical protein
MRLDDLSGGFFVFLKPERGKEILEEIWDFSSPPVLSSKVAKMDYVELPRSIFERARAYILNFTLLWLKISVLIDRNLWERAPSVSSALRSPIISSLKSAPQDLVSKGDGKEWFGKENVPSKNDYFDPNYNYPGEVTIHNPCFMLRLNLRCHHTKG